MKTSNKVIATSVAAAVVVGGTALLMNDQPDQIVDDVTPVTVEIPTITIPTINIPKVNIATVNLPEVNNVIIPSQIELEKYGLTYEVDKINVPTYSNIYSIGDSYKVSLPNSKSITVKNIGVATITSVVPELADVVINNPNITTSELMKYLVNMPNISEAKIKEIIMVIPTVVKGDDRIAQVQEFMKQLKETFKDQRGILHDNSLNIDNKGFAKWLKIYKENKQYQLEYVKVPSGIKMIAEIHYPINIEVMDKNLEFYNKQGYNSVLVTFGYGNEDINQLLTIVDYIKSKDMKVWFAYAGPERLQHSVFYDPDKLKDNLQRFSRACDGFILGWRRTSLHLFEQDVQYKNYVLKCVRDVNSKIPVLGEAYFGQTASSNEQTRNLQYNVPKNSSGVLITGLGYNGVAVEPVVNNLLKDIKNYDRLAVILGDKPYYESRHNNGLSFMKNLEIKKYLENRWLKAGISGTITLHGDGSDGVYDKLKNDNIAQKAIY